MAHFLKLLHQVTFISRFRCCCNYLHTYQGQGTKVGRTQVDQIGRFIELWATLKTFGNK